VAVDTSAPRVRMEVRVSFIVMNVDYDGKNAGFYMFFRRSGFGD
jgi:hypothetical protein